MALSCGPSAILGYSDSGILALCCRLLTVRPSVRADGRIWPIKMALMFPHVGLSGGEKPRRSQRASRSQLSSGILAYWVCAAACDGVLKALCVCTVHRAVCVPAFSHRVCVRAAPLTLCGRVSERGGPWRHPRALISNCTCLRT